MSTAKVKAAAAPKAAPVAAAPKAAPKAAPVVPTQAASDAVTQIEQAVAVGKETVEVVETVEAVEAVETVETVEAVVAASRDAVEPVAEIPNEVAAKGGDQAEALAKGQADTAVKAQVAAFQAYEEAVSSAKDAVAQAGTIFSKGLQDIGKLVLGLAQASVEEGVAASQQLLAAKTLRELVDVQSAVAKQQFDRLLGESSRLSDLSVKLVEESFAPLTERVTATVEKMVKRAA